MSDAKIDLTQWPTKPGITDVFEATDRKPDPGYTRFDPEKRTSVDNSASFMIRKKNDGSLDSICLGCFRTVTAAYDDKSEAALEKANDAHVCDSENIYQRRLYESRRSDRHSLRLV